MTAMKKEENMLLAGDVGGTKTLLAIFSPEAGPRAPLVEATFPSARFDGLESVVQEFLAQTDLSVRRASFGIAGPIVGAQARVTNLPWLIDEAELRTALDLSSASILNDLQAIAHAVPFLEPADLHTLNEGNPDPGGAIAVIAPGTGLGEAFLTWDGVRYRPHPSEGGHVDFAPLDELQLGLLRHLQEHAEHVSYERVCSGRGLPIIYAYLKDIGFAEEPDWLAERLAAAFDPTPIIANAGLECGCKLSRETLDLFVAILGAEAGNLALKVMATGGVYLGGGMPRKILPALKEGRLMRPFLSKGRFRDLLARVPVHVILNPRTALMGAACHGLGL